MDKLTFFSHSKRKCGMEIPSHSHSVYEIVYYGAGSGGRGAAGDYEYSFKEGTLVIIGKDDVHSEFHESDGEVYFLGVESDRIYETDVISDLWHIKPVFESIIQEAKNQEFCFEKIISCKIGELFAYAKRAKYEKNSGLKDLSFCKRYIDENYMYDVTVTELSKMCGYSYDYFRKLFTQKYKASPQQYLIDKRIESALFLLKHTTEDCTAIAYNCGFSDSGQFAKMIKARCGKTPTQIRGLKNR